MKRTVIVGLATLVIGGCASIVNEKTATIAIAAPNCPEGTSCALKHKKGQWHVKVPGTVTIPKSDDPLKVDCATPDGRTSHQVLESRMGGSFWGNIIAGGGIGMIIDANTDAHRSYDSSVVVDLCR